MSPVAMLATTATQQTTMSSVERDIPIPGEAGTRRGNYAAGTEARWYVQPDMV